MYHVSLCSTLPYMIFFAPCIALCPVMCEWACKEMTLVLMTLGTHSASSLRWGGPCTSRGTWPRTRSSGRPVERYPTVVPRTRSSMWARWRSTAGSCAASCWRWGRWAPAGSSCTRASSAHTITTIFTHLQTNKLLESCSCNRLFNKLFAFVYQTE